MKRLLRSAQLYFRSASFRQLMGWCLPALLLGLTLRVVLTVQLPWALMHDDTFDFLSTTDSLLQSGKISIHEKKTFFYPFFLTAHALLPIPALLTVPLTQHALGLVLIVLVGALMRAWFRFWRWFIVPVTALVAVNPHLLWYEHVLMAETLYVFCTVLLALAGTVYAERQSRAAFIGLCAALVLEAGARPEGKLLFGFALLLLVLVHRKSWRLLGARLAVLGFVALATHLATRTEQAGLLLYTSVARLTPETLGSAPGFEPYIAPVRTALEQRWNRRRSFPGAEDRRSVASAVKTYLKENGRKESSENFCQRLAIETCARRAIEMPLWILHKLQATADLAPSGRFNFDWLLDTQKNAITGSLVRWQRLAPRLTGQTLGNESEISAFLEAKYTRVRWFNRLHTEWTTAVAALHFPGEIAPQVVADRRLPGVPIYFAIAAGSLLALMLRRSPLQPFHIAWGLAFTTLFAVILLTANIRPRFRIAYEPFWIIYLAMTLDLLIGLIPSRARASSADRSDPPADR